MASHDDFRPDTLLQHFAEEEKLLGAVAPPIFQNSLFVFPTCEALWSAMQETPCGPPYHYSRVGNPTLDVVERKLANLEGTESAKVFAGGMAAISTAIIGHVEAGSHVVVADTCYGPVRMMFEEFLPRFGVTHTFVDGRCHEEVLDNIRPETSLIYLESPSSFLFRLQDLEAIAKGAREKGVTTICDNSYATPLFQNPAKLGIDVVVHSATKYLAGHSDLTVGVMCGSQERIERLVRKEISILASLVAPFGAWQLLRGMRTLGVRMKAHQEGGNAVATYLEDRPEVERVFHTGLTTFPQRELFQKQMRGSSSLLSFEPKRQDLDYVKRFVDSLEIFQIGVSWGGFESLSVPVEAKPKEWEGPRWLVRLYIGLEDVGDLIADIDQAFAKAAEA